MDAVAMAPTIPADHHRNYGGASWKNGAGMVAGEPPIRGCLDGTVAASRAEGFLRVRRCHRCGVALPRVKSYGWKVDGIRLRACGSDEKDGFHDALCDRGMSIRRLRKLEQHCGEALEGGWRCSWLRLAGDRCEPMEESIAAFPVSVGYEKPSRPRTRLLMTPSRSTAFSATSRDYIILARQPE